MKLETKIDAGKFREEEYKRWCETVRQKIKQGEQNGKVHRGS